MAFEDIGDIAKIQEYYNQEQGDRQVFMMKYYKNDEGTVPIYSKESASSLKEATHTTLHINFFKDIVSRKVGYMGQDIEYVTTSEDETLKEALATFQKETKQKTINSSSVSVTTIQGISHRLCYTEDGIFKTKNIDGNQVVYDYDNDIYNPKLAYYFYSITSMEGESLDYCDVYDDLNVYYYSREGGEKEGGQSGSQEDGGSGEYKPLNVNGVIFQPHNFDQVPMIPFINNDDMVSDCEDSVAVMDEYDNIISDTAGELKAARLAYLKIWGDLSTQVTPEGTPIPLNNYLTQFGAMLFAKSEQGEERGDAEFMEKKLDDKAITNMLDRFRGHIFELSGSLDITDLIDSAGVRVITVNAIIERLDDNAKTTGNYFKQALLKQLNLWIYYQQEMNRYTIDPAEISINIYTSFMTDEGDRASTLNRLLQGMSPLDAYTLLGYDDPTGLTQRYLESQAQAMNAEIELLNG